jgi:hypothetical protein
MQKKQVAIFTSVPQKIGCTIRLQTPTSAAPTDSHSSQPISAEMAFMTMQKRSGLSQRMAHTITSDMQ